MDKKNLMLMISIVFVIAAIFIVDKPIEAPNPSLYFQDDTLNYQAYSFVSSQELMEKVDLERSDFELLNIFLKNDEEKEINIKDLDSIYRTLSLVQMDDDLIPLGKSIRVRYQAKKGDLTVDRILLKTLDYEEEVIVFNKEGKVFKTDEQYLIEDESGLKEILDLNAWTFKYGLPDKSLALNYEYSIDFDQNGNYEVSIVNEDYDVDIEFNIQLKKKEVVIPVEAPTIKVPTQAQTPSAEDESKVLANLHSISVLVNKERHLSSSAVPPLQAIPSAYAINASYYAQPAAVSAFVELVDSMKEETGMIVLVTSAYRSYSYQESLFNRYASRDGVEAANRYSARAGQSEHQTGLALDLLAPGVSMDNFGSTQESLWVAQNAARFGFIIRYPQGKEAITGYQYEPWHLRYLGKDLAQSVQDSGLTYDEYWALYLQ